MDKYCARLHCLLPMIAGFVMFMMGVLIDGQLRSLWSWLLIGGAVVVPMLYWSLVFFVVWVYGGNYMTELFGSPVDAGGDGESETDAQTPLIEATPLYQSPVADDGDGENDGIHKRYQTILF